MLRAMHTGFAKAALCMALFVCGTPMAAHPVTDGVAQLEYGYMCKLATEEEMMAEDTLSGTVSLVTDPPPFTYRGTTVPAEIGVEFGVRVQVLPEFEGPATVHVEHPPHGAAGITRESWQTWLSAGDMGYASFSFEADYEVTPGKWTMSASANGRLIYSVTFDVIAPMGSATDAMGCNEPEVVS
ncbi:hypothetical protein A3731_02275 [Roseovarius sp. HI0049]|nr:hypothetical protein A3731_02275 [Roseovarius sp. HI0049]